ncbi:hypothetical protein HCN51_21635 [Nonomuraea sp. FMUSA5-5]|uniref:Uncharacterized protein n=1 Tax=Nonomuraea composti TaxID=2720023 RepID=A0ABX1B9S4_9ACTN|nr:hypothetical protein [Nonomuraea sp. FMUSA5-5]NJP92031.1 hypothetical protein [Nonomuraea sp. FMUSA5-5]
MTTPFTAGMALPSPAHWGVAYVDGQAPFTNFARPFVVDRAKWYSVLEVEVLTFYEDLSRSAAVFVGSTQIGVITPRPVSQFGSHGLQVCSFNFSGAAYGGSAPYSGTYLLRIEPVSPSDPLIVGNWRVFYDQYV